ncbi:hypothetical protein SUGI_1027180 [Cryptomeria japonica]|nr:hypothetical protein SUGI_1027180 [Cryptomeria japonica]
MIKFFAPETLPPYRSPLPSKPTSCSFLLAMTNLAPSGRALSPVTAYRNDLSRVFWDSAPPPTETKGEDFLSFALLPFEEDTILASPVHIKLATKFLNISSL